MPLRMLFSVLLQAVVPGNKSGCDSEINLVFITQHIFLVCRALERSEVAFPQGPACPRSPLMCEPLRSLILELIFTVTHLTFHTLETCCLFLCFFKFSALSLML